MIYNITLTHSPNSGGTYVLTNCSGASFSWGRQNILDDYQGITYTFYGFNPSGWTKQPVVGDGLGIQITPAIGGWTGTANAPFTSTDAITSYVSDFTVRYGLKPSMDTWELTTEGEFATFARRTGSITTTAGAGSGTFSDSIATLAGNPPFGSGTGYRTTTTAQTMTNTVNGFTQLLLRNDGGRVAETVNGVTLAGANSSNSQTDAYSDIPGDGKKKYSEIVFRSAADNVASKVTVNPSGLASQTSGSGTYTFQVDTISGSTTEAADLAGYYKTILDMTTGVPYSITSTNLLSPSPDVPYIFRPGASGMTITIEFRGSTYTCMVIGADFSCDGQSWRGTAYLVSSLQYAWLTLDSSTLGILDTNKLGL